jgi:hypothetical protein
VLNIFSAIVELTMARDPLSAAARPFLASLFSEQQVAQLGVLRRHSIGAESLAGSCKSLFAHGLPD